MMPNTNDIEKKFHISRQTIYLWRKNGLIKVKKDWNGRLLWDENAIGSLSNCIETKKNSNLFGQDNILNDFFSINNRRYLGSKERLLDFIDKVVNENTKNVNTVADIFSGTGVVADMFARQGKRVILNDILHANYRSYITFFGNEKYDKNKVIDSIQFINNIKEYGDDYLVKTYGNRYFSLDNSKKIGSAREWLNDNKSNFNEREFSIILTSIIYAADKVANTVGHYDAFRKHMDSLNPVRFKIPKISDYKNSEIFMEDANDLVKKISADLVYIDTPYNSRQYVDTYHVLENISDWKKPEVVGVSRKSVDRSDRKSKYNFVSAPKVFDDLIQNISSKYVLVSFNNMSNKGSGRSNAKISHDEIIESLSKRGKVKIFSSDFQVYNTGKTNVNDHKEMLYLLEILK